MKKPRITNIKICGLKRLEDIRIVNRLQPDYVGFVFAPGKRTVSMNEAELLSRHLDEGICPVGVYVNAHPDEIRKAVSLHIIRAVQLHGQETAAEVLALKRQIPAEITVMKAVSMAAGCEAELKTWQESAADYLLLDAGSGGTGKGFDHSLLHGVLPLKKPWFLAGGMEPATVDHFIHCFSPDGIDVSSGVETEGYKDEKKIEMMIRRVRNE